MKKLSIVLLAVLLIASLIISCDNSTKAITDELVEVQLGTQAGSRALASSVTLEQISDPSLKWFYSARKETQPEFATGQTTRSFIRLGDTKTFSQGKWTFILWAEKGAEVNDAGNTTTTGKKVYEGKLEHVLITKSSSPVPVVINVSPYVENENGTLVFNGVKIKAATSTSTDEVTFVPNTVIIDGTSSYDLDSDGSHEPISLTNGPHEVLVSYIGDDDVVYASETITITIYSNRVTTLSGMVDEETAYAEITVVGTAVTVKQENIDSKIVEDKYVNDVLTINAPVTPAKAVDKTESSVTVMTTDVTFDEGAFTLTEDKYKAELKIDTTSIEDSNFAVEGADATSGLTSVAGLDIVLKVNNSDVTDFNSGKNATVTTYIAKNLTSVGVRYKNPKTGVLTSYTIDAVDTDPVTISNDGYYIASSGKLVFKTTHFSEYYVVANARAYIKENNSAYSSLTDAITAVDNDQTIVILDSYTMPDSCNHPVTGTAKENSVSVNNGKTFSIDFNAKTVTGKMYIQSGFVTLKNGVFGGLDQTINIYGNTEDSEYNSVTIEEGMTITTATDGYGIILRDRGGDQKMYYGTTVNVNGIINAGTSGIFVMGNIIYAPESTVNPMSVFVGSKAVINADEIAINQNGLSYVVINDGAQLTAGKTAVEVRAGALEINGGIFLAQATPTSVSSNGSGSSTVGAAVAIAQHTTAQPIRVEVNGGTFTAYTALNEADPEGNNSNNVSIVVNDGTFNKLPNQEVGVVVNSNSKVLEICGGAFKTDPTEYARSGYYGALCEDGYYKLQVATNWINVADTSWYTGNESETSYDIKDAAELAGLARLVNSGKSFAGKTINLTADIDLSGKKWTPIGLGNRRESDFSGMFDGDFNGNSKTITGLTIEAILGVNDNNASYGLFGCIFNAKVRDLTITGASISTDTNTTGVAVGYGYNSEVTGVTATECTVTGYQGIGIIGRMYDGGKISNCKNNGCTFTAQEFTGFTNGTEVKNVGGIVGAFKGNIILTNNEVDLSEKGRLVGKYMVSGIVPTISGTIQKGADNPSENFTGNKVRVMKKYCIGSTETKDSSYLVCTWNTSISDGNGGAWTFADIKGNYFAIGSDEYTEITPSNNTINPQNGI